VGIYPPPPMPMADGAGPSRPAPGAPAPPPRPRKRARPNQGALQRQALCGEKAGKRGIGGRVPRRRRALFTRFCPPPSPSLPPPQAAAFPMKNLTAASALPAMPTKNWTALTAGMPKINKTDPARALPAPAFQEAVKTNATLNKIQALVNKTGYP